MQYTSRGAKRLGEEPIYFDSQDLYKARATSLTTRDTFPDFTLKLGQPKVEDFFHSTYRLITQQRQKFIEDYECLPRNNILTNLNFMRHKKTSASSQRLKNFQTRGIYVQSLQPRLVETQQQRSQGTGLQKQRTVLRNSYLSQFTKQPLEDKKRKKIPSQRLSNEFNLVPARKSAQQRRIELKGNSKEFSSIIVKIRKKEFPQVALNSDLPKDISDQPNKEPLKIKESDEIKIKSKEAMSREKMGKTQKFLQGKINKMRSQQIQQAQERILTCRKLSQQQISMGKEGIMMQHAYNSNAKSVKSFSSLQKQAFAQRFSSKILGYENKEELYLQLHASPVIIYSRLKRNQGLHSMKGSSNADLAIPFRSDKNGVKTINLECDDFSPEDIGAKMGQ